ncbi:MAG TPA: FHA domain-containing protein [Pyrinomonadaceae bacterium]|nr:FHA domain-containing protein [Pyrinomonadaceae bacterium]
MNRCQSCSKENLDRSQFCEECGARLARAVSGGQRIPSFAPQSVSNPGVRISNITSVGIPPLVEASPPEKEDSFDSGQVKKGTHARLLIERGGAANTEFQLSSEESYIGRWDADNGIFPDVDLDAHDPDAKVSRRHARIIFRNNVYMIEDLGSTNGTFINRGRRLLPGSPQVLTEGDEIIVGKTFLRFHINS